MPRRNRRAQDPDPREYRGLENLVIPKGRCYLGGRKGKLKFSKSEAEQALAQAKKKRIATGSGHSEKRIYCCNEEAQHNDAGIEIRPAGCGFWHLTSQAEYKGPKR